MDRPAAPPAAGPPATALDAGAGTGFLPPLLARQGYQVTTADLSVAMLQILTSKAAPAGSTSTPPTPTLPACPGQTFDAVVERHLLCTCPTQA